MMTKTKQIRRSRADFIFDSVIMVILTLIFLIVAYPLYFIIISSISEPNAVASGQVLFYPVGFTFQGYAEVFKDERIIKGFMNSIILTVLGTIVSLAVTLPTAYALSRNDFVGRRPITIFYVITMFVSGGMIPTYLVVQSCGLLDTVWSLIIPGALGFYNVIIARTFFKSNLPMELLEAARLDGCGNTRFFFRIAIPLSGAVIAILVLYCGVGYWNSYFSALLYISDENKFPLQLVLRSILVLNEGQLAMGGAATVEQMKQLEEQRKLAELMKYSLIIVSSIPVLVVYPFVQKHFVKGVMIGSVKG